jgi:hypothetical protein
MGNVDHWVEAGRVLLHEDAGLTEAEFRERMLERFRENDLGLQQDKRAMTASPAVDSGSAFFAALLLPWTIFRWLGWRGRLARQLADMDVAVRVLRGEGHFAAHSPGG